MEKLSVALMVKNNEDSVRACLESVKWADEIVILDGFSTDKTLEVCRQYTDKIFQKKLESFPADRNFILNKTTNRWVLSVDADMVFPVEFCSEVREILKNPRYDGYVCRCLTLFLGREIRHCSWFDCRALRFFNKEKGHYDLSYLILDIFQIPASRLGRMRQHFLHFQNESYEEYFRKIIDRYALKTALEYQAKGVRIAPANVLWYFCLKPFLVFLYKYVYKRGFLDGIPGLIVCVNSAISYYSAYGRLWDLQRTGK